MTAMRAKMQIINIEKFDTIKQDGWKLDNFRNNPVILWGHDKYCLPIGKAPDGWLSLTIANPDLLGKFSVGEKYYLDFKPAP